MSLSEFIDQFLYIYAFFSNPAIFVQSLIDMPTYPS